MTKSEHESEKQASDNEESKKEKEEITTTKDKKRRPDVLYGKGEYRILGKKGEGTFSEVLKCQNIKDGTYWACKKMKQTYDSLEQVNNLREIQAMRRLATHSNILELEEVIFDKKSATLVLILELMDMNIYELIRGKRHFLPEFTVKKYMYQLCRSVDHMHRNGIFHRDVKPENILIKEDVLKLADFGSCRSVYSKQPYTEYISTRCLHPLFPGANEVDQIAKIHDIMGTPESSVLNKLKKSRGMNFNFPSKKGSGIERMLQHSSTDAVDLIYKMCMYDPDERMTAKQALRHPYFKELRETDKRQMAIARTKQQEKVEQNAIPSPEQVETTRSEIYDKKKDSELHIIASLPKPQSLPAHQLFKDKRKVYQNENAPKKQGEKQNFGAMREIYERRKRLVDNSQSTYNTNHTGFFPKVPLHASTINPSYHASSFPSTFSTHNASNQLSLLPSISSTYKTHKANPSKQTKNMFSHYQLPSLDRRGAGF